MATSDYFRKNRVVSSVDAARIRSLAVRNGQNVSLVDPVQDETWAYMSVDKNRPSNYFDYYFTGQDIKVRVAEIPETDTEFGEMPIIQLSLNIEQEKQPIYGYWDYTFSAVMRGTRLVSGAFAIATKYPDYMKDLLAKAAKNRSNNQRIDSYNYPQPLTEDDKNIEQYWGRSIYDPGVYAQLGEHIFSSHPPFSMVVAYNYQTTSLPLDKSASSHWQDYYTTLYNDPKNNLATDENNRITDSDPNAHQNRFVIDNIELKSCQRDFSPDGSVCMETYAFFARDVIVPPTTMAALQSETNKNLGIP